MYNDLNLVPTILFPWNLGAPIPKMVRLGFDFATCYPYQVRALLPRWIPNGWPWQDCFQMSCQHFGVHISPQIPGAPWHFLGFRADRRWPGLIRAFDQLKKWLQHRSLQMRALRSSWCELTWFSLKDPLKGWKLRDSKQCWLGLISYLQFCRF